MIVNPAHERLGVFRGGWLSHLQGKLGIVLALLVMLSAGQANAAPELPVADKHLPGVALAQGLSEITGVAVSPMLGLSVVSAWKYYHTPSVKRASLPWHCSPYVWGTGFTLLALCLLKDMVGTVTPPLIKKPLDIAELFESKLSALVVSTAFIPLLAAQFGESLPADGSAIIHQAAGAGLAVVPLAASSLITKVIMVIVSVVLFLTVWLAFHTINVFIALSPFGLLDGMLKLVKAGILALVVVSAALSPWIGAAVAVLIVAVAALIAPWAFRITVFGTLLGLDCLRFRSARHREGVSRKEVRCFTAGGFAGVPVRTFGTLKVDETGRPVFCYRPRLIQPERSLGLHSTRLAVIRGMLWPSVAFEHDDGTTSKCVLNLLPRYRTLEEEIVGELHLGAVRPGLVLKGYGSLVAWCKETAALGKSGVSHLAHQVHDSVAEKPAAS